MWSEMKQSKVSQEMTVCACAEYASQGNGLQNYLAECCTAPARVSLTVHSQLMISPGNALIQPDSVNTPGGCPPSQKQQFLPLPVHMEGYLCNLGKGNSIFLRMEKYLLCGRENFLRPSTEFSQFTLWGVSIRVRLEEGGLRWFWEALTQKGESDS